MTVPARSLSWSARHSFGLAALSAFGGALVTSALWLAFAAPDGGWVRVRDQVAMAPVIAVQPKYVSTDEWSTAVSAQASNAVFPVEVSTSSATRTGAGVAFIDDGHLIVPAHLLVDAKSVVVTTRQGIRLPATVNGVDLVNDIGVIKVDEALTTAIATRSTCPDNGQAIALVGAAGTDRPVWQTSVLSVDQRAPQASATQTLFRIDSPIEATADGGAVVDSTGAVIGIATIPPQASSRDGFVIPMTLAKSVAWDLITVGSSTYPQLGFDGARTDGMRDQPGVRVLSVNQTGLAAAAGLRKDDIVIAADGASLSSMTALIVHARERGTGNQMSLDILRNEKPMTISIALSTG